MGAKDELIENLTYDELQPGQRARMQRTLRMDDINAFALVSGDVNPSHVDAAYAESTDLHGVTAHGMWAAALISGLLGNDFPGAGTVYLEQTLRFQRPVRLGDTLTVGVQVLAKDDATHNVRLGCEVHNQRGEAVLLDGPPARLRALAQGLGLTLDGIEVVGSAHSHASAAAGAALAARGEVGMLMKGSLHTDELMAAVLAEPALRTGRRMSHVFRFEVPAYPKPLLVTDAAINIAPSLEDKADILRNVIGLAQALGVAQPRVALLAAVETVTPRLVSTLDAAALCKMAQRGQIAGALVDGPLGFDNAISAEAARIKGIVSEVAGQADVLMVPDIESGNMLAKQLEYLAGAASCGVVLGASVPIALTSRADTELSRLASAVLAGVVARQPRPPRRPQSPQPQKA